MCFLLSIKGLNKTRYLVQAALIASLYTVLTIAFAPLSFGGQQFRISEALAVLPAITPAAIPGLFLGCVLSNTFSFMGLPDLIFGSISTLISAILTSFLCNVTKDRSFLLKLALIPAPPVVINAFVIGAMLKFVAGIPFIAAALGVFVGQFCACYLVGCPLYLIIRNLEKRSGAKIFHVREDYCDTNVSPGGDTNVSSDNAYDSTDGYANVSPGGDTNVSPGDTNNSLKVND